MSRRVLERRPLRALSDSDTDEDNSHSSGVQSRYSKTKISKSISGRSSYENSSAHSSNHATHNLKTSNNSSIDNTSSNINNNNGSKTSHTSLNSSQINRLLEQDSVLYRIRWNIFKNMYLAIISLLSFDVWLLSKVREGRKLLLLFIPLVMYLIYCAIIWSDSSSVSLILSSSSTQTQRFLSLLKPSFLSPSPLSALTGYFPSIFERNEDHSLADALSKEQKYEISPKEMESMMLRTAEKIYLDQRFHFQEAQYFKLQQQLKEDLKNNAEQNSMKEEISLLNRRLEMFEEQLIAFKDQHKIEKKSTHIGDAVTRFVEQEMLAVKGKLIMLDKQLIAFKNQQNVDSSHFSKDVEKLSVGQEVWKKKLNNLQDQLNSQKLDFETTEQLIMAAFQSVVKGDQTSPYYFFNEWLHSKLAEIKSAIENVRKECQKQDKSCDTVVEGLVRHYVDLYMKEVKPSVAAGYSVEWKESDGDVRKIVRDAILLYDADKTGLVDYALESAGGSVVSIRCSESYAEKRGQLSLFGFPLWTDHNSPRIAIQPDVHPGRCWSFKGSRGFLVVQLSYTIRPTGFTLEHIPASLSPTGSIDSAPNEFSVWGLSSETETEGILLGEYSYDDKGDPLQYFTVQNATLDAISFVELKILSNHGNLEYTCLYRFRVHGTHV